MERDAWTVKNTTLTLTIVLNERAKWLGTSTQIGPNCVVCCCCNLHSVICYNIMGEFDVGTL